MPPLLTKRYAWPGAHFDKMRLARSSLASYDDRMSRHRYRILLIDDDARLRDLLNRYLSEQGFR